MNMERPACKTIGVIRTPFSDPQGMPIQPAGAKEVVGTVEIAPEYAEGLQDLEGFSHLFLIYRFHRAARTELKVTPFLDTCEHGVFATRSPLRPNHIGLSVVELLEVEGSALRVRGIDVLDGTPLLDVKPYVAAFDHVEESRSGWMIASSEEVGRKRSDARFS